MKIFRRMMYMGFGALLMLALVAGGVMVFAQSGDDEVQAPETQGEDETTQDDATENGVQPQLRAWPFRGREVLAGEDGERLAEALGITVEELQAAHEEVRLAVIDQALEEGLITEEQAQRLRESERPFRADRAFRNLDINRAELLADALGISVEALQEARAEVRATRLAELVEEGVITQEQADLLTARQAVSDYIDREALAQTLQDAYEQAIDAALADGAITQEQADTLLENMPTFESFRFGFGGQRHHGRGRGPGWGGMSAPDVELPPLDTSFDI